MGERVFCRALCLPADEKAVRSLEERFMRKVRISSGCWEWTGTKTEQGYGRIGIDLPHRGAMNAVQAHRVAWLLFVDDIPDGIRICHKCDNPGCVNPGHLFMGTARDNTQDMIRKGRGKLAENGLRMRGRRLSPQIRAKMSLAKQGAKHPFAIAVVYRGVTYPTITAAAQAAGITPRAMQARAAKARASGRVDLYERWDVSIMRK